MNSRLITASFVVAAALVMNGTAFGESAPDSTVERTAQTIVVTATRSEQRLEDVAANVTVMTGAEVRSSGVLFADDLLRQIPGFTLLRQASSLVSSNGIQSASMRGIGGTAAARTLLLMDGVPMSDPFSSAMAWSQVPTERIERIEVLRGGGAGIWGNLAMGGVVHILTETPRDKTFHFTGQGGDNETVDVDASYGDRVGKLAYLVGGHRFQTGGYYVYPESQRGDADAPSRMEHSGLFAKGVYTFEPKRTVFVNGFYYDEHKELATVIAVSEYVSRTLSVGSDWDLRSAGRIQTLLFSTTRDRTTTNVSVPADRNTERPTANTYGTPTQVLGASLQWSKKITPLHQVSVGGDHQWLDAELRNHAGYITASNSWRTDRVISGNQTLSGAYVQDVFSPSLRWQLVAGARVDHVAQSNGRQTERSFSTGVVTSDTSFSNEGQTVFSPSLGAVFHAANDVSIRSSAYQSFRAPTLSELYTSARSGDVVIVGNSELESEELTGGDLGVDFHRSSIYQVRVTGFWSEVENTISQRTVGVATPDSTTIIDPCGAVPPGGNCRQTDNVGTLRSRGIELDASAKPFRHWTFSGSYYFADSRIVESDDEALVGNWNRNVPEHSFTLRSEFHDPRICRVGLMARYTGERFEDDRNTLHMDGFLVLNLSIGRQLNPVTEMFLSIENLMDEEYVVRPTTTGYTETGVPRQIHGGVRVRI